MLMMIESQVIQHNTFKEGKKKKQGKKLHVYTHIVKVSFLYIETMLFTTII